MSDNLYRKLSEERKQLQEQGLVPQWYTTGGYQLFKEKYDYQTEGRSVKGQFERIAKTAAKHLKGTKFESQAEEKFFELFWKGWLSPSTPVLANMGTTRGMPVSCSGTIVEDSIDGFYSNLHEIAMLTKNGFGTASDFSHIRPRGSKIANGGKANGVIPVIKEHVQCMRSVTQGTARRGAWAVYLKIDHGDFDELIDLIQAEPDDLNVGWTITNEFLDGLNKGNPENIRRFQRAMKTKLITGKGYFFFVDKANEKRPQMYKDLGLTINNSQLCVAPETLILTDMGYQQIVDLEDESVNVWNGETFSTVTVRKTGENQKLLTVKTNSGFELDCTPYHKFYVYTRNPNSGNVKIIEKRTHELLPGDKLLKCNFPIIEGTETLEYAYDNGLFSAEGCYTDQGKRLYLYHEKRKLKQYLSDIYRSWTVQNDINREYSHSNLLREKFFVPTGNFTVKSKMEWFAGLCDGDATIARCGKTQGLQLASTNKNFLLEIQMMLQTTGVSSKVTLMHEAGWLHIGQTGICVLKELGFNPKRLLITDHVPNRECSQYVKVTEIVDNGRIDDTYCFTEPIRGMGVFNGLLTGQCSEITLFNDKDHTYSCVLSSMNAAKYNEWKETDAAFWALIFLDCVASEFIEKAKDIPGLEKTVRFTEKSRALGLGLAGLHTLFMQEGLAFESFGAHMLSQEIQAKLWDDSLKASQELAIELGEPEWCKGYGVRNSHRLAIAPTKSTALIMGGISEGINPSPAMCYTQLTAAGEVERIDAVLLQLMKDKGVYNKKNIQQIIDKQGSVQHVDWLNDEEKTIFKTAFEINQKSVIRMASARSKYLDQWQSLNLFFSAEEDPAWIAEVHQEAFNDPNILALYYIHSQAGVQAAKGECESCM